MKSVSSAIAAMTQRPTVLTVTDLHKRCGSRDVLTLTRDLAAEGRTMTVVTHEMGFAVEVSNQTLFLYQGMVKEAGHSRDVLIRPQEDRLRQFPSGGLK
jgi:ABC-type histidine transport system ATPase subunit